MVTCLVIGFWEPNDVSNGLRIVRRRLVLVLASSIASTTALAQERWERSVSDHKDWIRSCTDSSIDLTTQGALVIYSINSGSETVSVIRCLLDTVEVVPKVRVSDSWLAIPFRSHDEPRPEDGADPTGFTEILIRTAEQAIVVSGIRSEWGISEITDVSGDLLLITTAHVAHRGVYKLDPSRGTVEYLTNGLVEVVDEDIPIFKVHGRKHYFNEGGAFWISAVIDGEGNILDVPDQGGLCLSVDELSERSSLDLTRVVRPEVCVSR